ncbi:MAG: ferritin family protein [Candidatus Bathyarchaeia archaeon]
MLSQIPVKVDKVEKKLLDCEILRAAIIAELDAINLYEQLAAATTSENIRKVLLEVAREEKTHMGEFQTLLLKEDKEQVKELEKGGREVEEMMMGKSPKTA